MRLCCMFGAHCNLWIYLYRIQDTMNMNTILVCWVMLAVIMAACPGAEGRRSCNPNRCRYCESKGKECYWIGGQCRCRNFAGLAGLAGSPGLPTDPRLERNFVGLDGLPEPKGTSIK